jgi:hypothetical protein
MSAAFPFTDAVSELIVLALAVMLPVFVFAVEVTDVILEELALILSLAVVSPAFKVDISVAFADMVPVFASTDVVNDVIFSELVVIPASAVLRSFVSVDIAVALVPIFVVLLPIESVFELTVLVNEVTLLAF